MATRFYLPSTGAVAVSPAYASEWEDTADASILLRISRSMRCNIYLETDRV